MTNKGRKFLTKIYVCPNCEFSIPVKIMLAEYQEHHAITYRQAISPDDCLRCKLKIHVANCVCLACSHNRVVYEALEGK